MSHLRSRAVSGSIPRWAAVAGLALGLLIALAANLTYAMPRGTVVVGVGMVVPLVLPFVLYLRTTFEARRWSPEWFVRELATLAVAGPAAAVSYWHTYSLVLHAGEPWILAILAPLSSDGLAGLATLALHRHRVAGKRTPVRKSAEPRIANQPAAGQAPEPAAVDTSDVAAEQPGDDDRAVLVARAREIQAARRAEGERPLGRTKLAEALSVSPAVARAVLEEIDESPVRLVVNA